MSHTPHELHETFPEAAQEIHALRETDAHFARLTEEYHTLNREIHRAETDVEPIADHALEDLKKRRLSLLDQIGKMLRRN